MKNNKLKLTFKPYSLDLKYVFTVSSNSRVSTEIMLIEIEYDGIVGYGEASLPPYLPETQKSVDKFLSKIDLSQFTNPLDLESIINYIDNIEPDNTAAKASVDIALHDLSGKMMNKPLYEIWGFEKFCAPETSFTIGLDTNEMVIKKTKEALNYNILKVKLSKDNDKEIIKCIRSLTNKTLYVDVNQGWTDKYYALDMLFWLKEMGIIFVEQPLPKENVKDIKWLTENSPLPIFADEGIQRLGDLNKISDVYSGINVKLMKSTGLSEARKLIDAANKIGMQTMIGCMTETSCAVTAAANLAPLCKFADLDGAQLITNDLFDGMKIKDGKIIMNDIPGIGVIKMN